MGLKMWGLTLKNTLKNVGNSRPWSHITLPPQGVLLRPGQHNYVAMTALGVDADDDIRQIEPGKRNCFFPDESPLQMHRAYSQANCILECSIEYARFVVIVASFRLLYSKLISLQAKCGKS